MATTLKACHSLYSLGCRACNISTWNTISLKRFYPTPSTHCTICSYCFLIITCWDPFLTTCLEVLCWQGLISETIIFLISQCAGCWTSSLPSFRSTSRRIRGTAPAIFWSLRTGWSCPAPAWWWMRSRVTHHPSMQVGSCAPSKMMPSALRLLRFMWLNPPLSWAWAPRRPLLLP